MDRLYTKAMGKINFSLDAINKRTDGYHNLKMVMQTVELHDILEIRKVENEITVICENSLVPANDSNIAYKAARALCDYTNLNLNVSIHIDKNIPVAAGMAGGSSDAAAVLKGINELFSLNLNMNELMKIGKTIGADVPYCLCGGTMLAEGIGDVLTPLAPLNGVNIVLVKPRIEVSTAWVFRNFINSDVIERPDTDALISALKKNDLKAIGSKLANVLESVTVKAYPIINEIKATLLDCGALGSIMSGSGPTVFGIFEDYASAQKAFAEISEMRQLDCYLTKTIC
jgi:4-diphosphocytidyl-2-C-methyl-D-erythritol kinase